MLKGNLKAFICMTTLVAVMLVIWLFQPRIDPDRLEGKVKTKWDRFMPHIIFALKSYKSQFGKYPSGDAAEICKALSGNNADKWQILALPIKHIGSHGEYLDRWSNPYLISITEDKISVRSAGPDKIYWNSDDLFLEH
jgi:hypothetical protein